MSSKVISVLSDIPYLVRELKRVLPQIDFRKINDLVDKEKAQLYASEIVIADGNLFVSHMNDLNNVKWVQMTWAGLDAIFNNNKFTGSLPYLVTRFSGHHFGRIMSEYVITSIVNNERNIFQIKKNQDKKLWDTNGKIQNYRTISDLTVGILGMGQIGSFIAQSLHFLGANILCYGRSVRNPDSIPNYIDKYYTKDTFHVLLQNSDYIINSLPSTDETRGLLNNETLKHCSNKQSVFINVGRGSIINENHLINALNCKWISGAILDVFETEPLSEQSLLWDMPQVLITPHVSAVSRAKDIAEQFAKNYNLFVVGQQIPTTVNFNEGY